MDPLSSTFAALADPTRRAILARLSLGEVHVGELARPFRISGPAVSRHLRVLENAGLIERQVSAQRRVCRLREHSLRQAHDWIDQYRRYWEDSLDRLVEYVEEQHARDSGAPPPVVPLAPASPKSAAASRPARPAPARPRTSRASRPRRPS